MNKKHLTNNASGFLSQLLPNPQPEPTNMNTQKLAEHALNTWTTNLMRLKNARFALFDIDGQYHGAFTDEPSAHAYVDEVASTPAWVGDGYQVVKFR